MHKKPTTQDYTGFWLYAPEYKLVSPGIVIEWYDQMIAASDTPPLWHIDISMGGKDEILRLLKNAVSEQVRDCSINLFFALVRRRWLHGTLSPRDVGQIAWQFHVDDRFSDSPQDWGVRFDTDLYYFERGMLPEDLNVVMDRYLSQYAEFEQDLPKSV